MAATVKIPALAGAQAPLDIEIEPTEDQGITMPVNVVPSFETGMAATPPMVNEVGEFKFVPLMETNVPTGPLDGVNEAIVGCSLTMNAPDTLLVAVPQVPGTTQ